MARKPNVPITVTKHVIVSPDCVVHNPESGDSYYNGTFSAISAGDGSLILMKSYGHVAMASMTLSDIERRALQRWFKEQG